MTLLVVLINIVDQNLADKVRIFLSIAAGAYLGIPVAHWIFNSFPAKVRNGMRGSITEAALLFGTTLGVLDLTLDRTSFLTALISATIKVDEVAARRKYADWYIDSREKNCVMSGRYQSWDTVNQRCLQHREQPVLPADPVRER